MATEAFLLFALERQRYAIRLSAIDGVDSAQAIRSVPCAPRYVLGLAHRRGRLLTVLDLPGTIDETSSGGSACLLRLAAPHEGLALFLPAAASIGHPHAPDGGTRFVEWQGRSHRLLLAGELVESALATET